MDYWPHGTHLVIAEPGRVRTVYGIPTDRPKIIAAVEELRVAMEQAMSEATRLRPESRAMTKAEQKAYDAWKLAMPNMRALQFEGVSMADVIDAGIKVLREKMEGGA